MKMSVCGSGETILLLSCSTFPDRSVFVHPHRMSFYLSAGEHFCFSQCCDNGIAISIDTADAYCSPRTAKAAGYST